MLKRHGDSMTSEERAAVERALLDPALLQKWADEIDAKCAPPNDELPMLGANGEFIDKLWNWFKENWPTILKLLLSLLIAL